MLDKRSLHKDNRDNSKKNIYDVIRPYSNKMIIESDRTNRYVKLEHLKYYQPKTKPYVL